jgi:hypothetical protein
MLSKTSKLYPTVRLQIVRDLYIREWQASAARRRARRRTPRAPPVVPQSSPFPAKTRPATPCSQERSRRLGRELFALFFPEELTATTPEAQRAATEKLSAYEQERNRQVRRRLAPRSARPVFLTSQAPACRCSRKPGDARVARHHEPRPAAAQPAPAGEEGQGAAGGRRVDEQRGADACLGARRNDARPAAVLRTGEAVPAAMGRLGWMHARGGQGGGCAARARACG